MDEACPLVDMDRNLEITNAKTGPHGVNRHLDELFRP
jgi:hypothetical protein